MACKRSIPLIQLKSPATFPLSSVKQEPLQSPPPPPPESIPISQLLTYIKTEPEPPSPPRQQPQAELEKEAKLLKSIDDLFSLSSAIDAFKCKFQELTEHLDSINQAIDSKLNDKTEKNRVSEWVPPKKSSRPEIELLCEWMCSKELRKYVATNLINVSKLRQEVPAALKLAPKPAKFVLDCIGRFFLQGVKAYTKDSRMIRARQASVLVLEFFLLMLGDSSGKDEANTIPADVKREAEQGAIAWRKRLIFEGGLTKASEVDARGLLLFVASFGIPNSFRIEDLGNLLRMCNLRAIADALKGSPLLSAKMPEVLEGMSKNGMYLEAIEIAAIFGLEDKFSRKTILTLFLEESTQALERARQEAHHSPVALKKVNQKQLDALKSILHYLEDRGSDTMSLVGEWHIEERIVKLEEEIAGLQKGIDDKKFTPKRKLDRVSKKKKRKLDEMKSESNVKNREMKHPWFAVKGSPLLKSSHVNGLHKQWTATLVDGTRSFDCLVPNSLDSDIYGQVGNYPAASSLSHGSAVGSLPKNGVGINGVGSCSMITGMGDHSAHSYFGDRVDIGVDKAEQMTSSCVLPHGLIQSSAAQFASMRLGNQFGSSSSVEGFNGPPELSYSGVTDRTATDLYGFVDAVGKNESYGNSSHRNSTLY